ncbi:MAG: hypothetical protein K1X78_16220 [Verrucomicrobiaceae bacterium]|nr:hypothetical protein [Verrucomicrobiaceae bacterium]
MSEFESYEVVSYEEDGFVIFIPSTWEQIEDDGGVSLFRHQSGYEVQVEKVFFEPGATSPGPGLEIELLRSRNDPEIETASTPIVLVSGAAMMSYRWREEAQPDAVTLYCELCRYVSPTVLAVIRFGSTIDRDNLDDVTVVCWSHIFRQMARMTEFPEMEDEILPA